MLQAPARLCLEAMTPATLKTRLVLGVLCVSCAPTPPIEAPTPPVTVTLGEQLYTGDLQPAMSAGEIDAWLAGFSWERAPVLAEADADGVPKLYYVNLFVKSRAEAALLDELHLHHLSLPYFAQERERWAGQMGRVVPPHNGRGIVRYAIIPGATYNAIRREALAGDALFEAIALREAPAEALEADGSLSMSFLEQSSFHYRGLEELREKDGTRAQGLVLLTVRTAAKQVAEATVEALRALARFAGERDRLGWFGFGGAGTAMINFSTQLLETDPAFGAKMADPTVTNDGTRVMTRTWGARRGLELKLEGVRISIWAKGDSTVLWAPTLFEARTNDLGSASIAMAKNTTVKELCIAAENDAVEVTDFLTEVEVCTFKGALTSPIDRLNGTWFTKIRVQDGYFNVLAQATEARAYLRTVAGFTPPKATVLVGGIANLIGDFNDGRAFAPCAGFPNISADLIMFALADVVGSVNPLAGSNLLALMPLMAVDIVLPSTHSGALAEPNLHSRGVLTHEYGHYAMCSMLYADSVTKISTVWTSAVINRLAHDKEPTAEKGIIIEGWADFFAGQVAGGTNYFNAGYTETYHVSYCPADRDAGCLDKNFHDDTTFEGQIARVTTTLHDAFDGHASLQGGADVDRPHNGDVWIKRPDGGYFEPALAGERRGDLADEQVSLSGPRMVSLVGGVSSLDEATFMGRLSSQMQAEGYGWCDRCKVFALHSPQLQAANAERPTDGELYAACGLSPIRGWLGAYPDPQLPSSCSFQGCAPGTVLVNPPTGPSFCEPCPAGTVSVNGERCDACPPGAVVVNNQCQTCMGATCTPACAGRSEWDGMMCRECADEQVAVNGVCQACAPGLLREGNACVAQCSCPMPVIVNGVCICNVIL